MDRGHLEPDDRVRPDLSRLRHCYALTLARRLKAMGNPKYQVDGDSATSGPGFGSQLTGISSSYPVGGRPRTIFVNSMSDLFHPEVPDSFIHDVFGVMGETPRHTYQVLTKRSKRLLHMAEPSTGPPTSGWVSLENARYRFRADHLRQTPAKTSSCPSSR